MSELFALSRISHNVDYFVASVHTKNLKHFAFSIISFLAFVPVEAVEAVGAERSSLQQHHGGVGGAHKVAEALNVVLE